VPPRGYRDEWKAGRRAIEDPERKARRIAAHGREHDLMSLVKMAMLQDRDGISAWAAAGKIADEISPNDARARHANQKRLHGKFQKAPALYQRLASAPDHPADAANREICDELGLKWFPRFSK
jgi:hypothetical protein